MLTNNANKKSKILIIGPTSEIAKIFLNKFAKNKSIMSISRSRIIHKSIKRNIILDTQKNYSKKRLLSYFKECKFNLAISFIANQDLDKSPIYQLSNKKILQILNTNAVFPIKLISCLIDLNIFVPKSKIIFFSSKAGSITNRGEKKHHKPKGNHVYRASKSLLNSFIKELSFQNKKNSKIIVAYDPGWVRTKSSGGGHITTDQAALNLSNFIKKIKKKHNGKFLDHKLKKIPW